MSPSRCAAHPPTYSVGGSVSGLVGHGGVAGQRRRRSECERERAVHVRDAVGRRVPRTAVTVKTNPSGQTLHGHERLGHGRVGERHRRRGRVLGARSGSTASDDFNRADGGLGASWAAVSDGGAVDLVAGGARFERDGRRHPHRRDVRERPVVAGRGDLDAADGRAVDRAGGADAERRPGHVPRDLLLEQRHPAAAAVQAQRGHLDPARQLVQLRRAGRRDAAAADGGRLDDLVPAERRRRGSA